MQQLKTNEFILDETFQIACLINKLPDTWTDFAKILSHAQGDLTFIQVLNSIRIEKQHRFVGPKVPHSSFDDD